MPVRPLLLKALGSEARLRILLTLAKYTPEELTIYKIAKFSGLDRKAIKRHVHKLVEADLVKRANYGALFVFKLNDENPHARKVVDLFNEARLLVKGPQEFYWTELRPTLVPQTRQPA